MKTTLCLAALTLAATAHAADPATDKSKPEASEGTELAATAAMGRRMELGIGFSVEAATPIWVTWPGDVGIANVELRLFPNPARDLSIDVQWNWSRLPLWGISAQPVFDVTTMAHWRLARRGRTSLAVAPGGRVLLGGAFGGNGPGNFFSTVTAVARIGMDVDGVHGKAVHSLYLRPEAGFSFSTPIATWGPQLGAALEYTVMWKVGKSATAWREATAEAVWDDKHQRASEGVKVAGLGLPEIADADTPKIELGTGLGADARPDNGGIFPMILPVEARFFLLDGRRTSVDMQWNWSGLLPLGYGYNNAPELDLAAFIHFRLGNHARTRFAIAPGLRGALDVAMARGENAYTHAFMLPVRIGVDHQGPERRINHGVYLRPTIGITSDIDWNGQRYPYPILNAALEYTVTWGLGRG